MDKRKKSGEYSDFQLIKKGAFGSHSQTSLQSSKPTQAPLSSERLKKGAHLKSEHSIAVHSEKA